MCVYIGDGKSHYIENELRNAPHHLKIAVNEAFTPLTAIKKLAVELPTDIPKCAVYFNFTMLPPGVSSSSTRGCNMRGVGSLAYLTITAFIFGLERRSV